MLDDIKNEEEFDVDHYFDFKGLSDEEKKVFLAEAMAPCSKMLLNVFLSCGIQNFIEQMCVNEATGKEYILTFQTKESFLKRVNPTATENK